MESKDLRLRRIDWSTCLVPTHPHRMDPEFVERLIDIQVYLQSPLRINTAYRSPEYEVSKGRTGLSTHCEGRAVDVHCTSSSERYALISAAIDSGICSIGIYKTFIHLDCGESRKQPLIWIG